MKRLNHYTGFFENEQELIHNLLQSWEPHATDLSEKDHEIRLTVYLRERLQDIPMITQYGIARGKADIVVEDKHLIELKQGFAADNPSEFQRCLGQLETYRQKWVDKERGPVFLVVVGESDTEFRDILHTWFKNTNSQYITWNPFQLIERPVPSLGRHSVPTETAMP